MDCPVSSITCRLDVLIGSLGAWDWNSFWATLLATLVGAAAAFGSAWLIARRQRRDENTTRLNTALGRVMERLTEDIATIEAYFAAVDAVLESSTSVLPWEVEKTEWEKLAPNLAPVRGLIYAARLDTTGDDAAAVAAILSMTATAGTLGPTYQQYLLDDAVELIWHWRDGSIPTPDVPTTATEVSKRRLAENDAAGGGFSKFR